MKSIKHICTCFLSLSASILLSQVNPDSTASGTTTSSVPVIESSSSIGTEQQAAPTETQSAAPETTNSMAVPSESSTATESTTVGEAAISSSLSVDSTLVNGTKESNSPAVTPSTNTKKPLSAKAQEAAWKKGNQHYSEQAYAEAIPYYEKILRSDSSNKILLTNLGECYRLTNNVDGQLLCYGGLIRQGKSEPIQELYYGQALAEKGEMEKAKQYFDKYSADSRGKNLSESFSKLASYAKNADAYSVTLLPYNSPENDMCAVKFHDAVVFCSTRKKQPGLTNNKGGPMEILCMCTLLKKTVTEWTCHLQHLWVI